MEFLTTEPAGFAVEAKRHETAYLVIGESGEYENFRQWVLGLYLDGDSATHALREAKVKASKVEEYREAIRIWLETSNGDRPAEVEDEELEDCYIVEIPLGKPGSYHLCPREEPLVFSPIIMIP